MPFAARSFMGETTYFFKYIYVINNDYEKKICKSDVLGCVGLC